MSLLSSTLTWLDDDKYRARKGQIDALSSGDGGYDNQINDTIGPYEIDQPQSGLSHRLAIDFVENSRLTSKSTKNVLLQRGSARKLKEESSLLEVSKDRCAIFSYFVQPRIIAYRNPALMSRLLMKRTLFFQTTMKRS